MNKEYINQLIDTTQNDVNVAKEISDKIVLDYTDTLDQIMRDIKHFIIDVEDAPEMILEQYFLTLTNAYYFIAPKCEILGLYEDVAKSNAKIKFNEAYGDNQLNNPNQTKKLTDKALTVLAENDSLNESIVAAIYSRSFKIVKSKLEAAETMISTLSKLISAHMSENNINSTSAANKIM